MEWHSEDELPASWSPAQAMDAGNTELTRTLLRSDTKHALCKGGRGAHTDALCPGEKQLEPQKRQSITGESTSHRRGDQSQERRSVTSYRRAATCPHRALGLMPA